MNSPFAERIVNAGPEIVARTFRNFGDHLDPEEFGLAIRLYETSLTSGRSQDKFDDGPWYGHRAEQSFYPASVSKLFSWPASSVSPRQADFSQPEKITVLLMR